MQATMLEKDFVAILREFGHNVYLQRRKEESESGPYRLVEGGRYQGWVEKWTIYRWFPGARMNVRKERLTPIGFLDGIDAVFYFQKEAEVKTGDLIHEDTPSERTVRDGYRVEKAIPYYLGNGVVYVAAHCKKLSPIA